MSPRGHWAGPPPDRLRPACRCFRQGVHVPPAGRPDRLPARPAVRLSLRRPVRAGLPVAGERLSGRSREVRRVAPRPPPVPVPLVAELVSAGMAPAPRRRRTAADSLPRMACCVPLWSIYCLPVCLSPKSACMYDYVVLLLSS